jgi:hypothetical protein
MSSTATTPAPQPLSEASRIINTFIAPSKTFTDLQRNASWWAPWLLIAIFSLAFVWTIDRQIGYEQVMKNQISHSSRAEQFEKLPPEQQARQMQMTTKFTRVISYASPVILLIFFVIIAAVLLGTFKFGASINMRFKTAMGIVSYAHLPGIIAAVLGIVALFAGVDPEGFNINNPVASNPAYFMELNGSKFLYTMASALDVFTIWSIILMGIGFACNSKVKRSTAIMIVVGWYIVYKLCAAGIAAAFS